MVSWGRRGFPTLGEGKAKSNQKAKVWAKIAERGRRWKERVGGNPDLDRLGRGGSRETLKLMRIWRPDWLDSARAGWYLTPGPVAQLVEQRTFNPTVRGSSPRGLTEKCMENSAYRLLYPVGGEAFLASELLRNFVDRIGSLVRNRRERIFLVTRSIIWCRPSDRTESRWLFPIRHRRAFRILSSVADRLRQVRPVSVWLLSRGTPC